MKDRFRLLAERWAAENAVKDEKLIESFANALQCEIERERAAHAGRTAAVASYAADAAYEKAACECEATQAVLNFAAPPLPARIRAFKTNP
jgi:hypothetical protein